MLISDDYRQLNADLHATRDDYGAGGHKWAGEVAKLVEEFGCKSILDYGCGKGSLAAELRRSFPDVREYDPAIAGKDTAPSPADLVVCTDVLEHIEPGMVDSVLDHLQKATKKVLLFSIATTPAKKFLADGRNAHLSLHGLAFWEAALCAKFEGVTVGMMGTNLVGIGKPRVYEIGSFTTIPASNDETRNDNVRVNCAKTPNRLQQDVPPHGRKAVLVCFGPSLKDTFGSAIIASAYGAHVFTVSGAHAFMVDKGFKPYAHIDCDPRPYKSLQFGEPVEGVKYWPASCLDPSYIDRLAGFDVTLWHLWNGEGSNELFEDIEPGAWALQGGGSVGLRALGLLYTQGYRDIEIHGMDCSQREETHAGKHVGKPQKSIEVRCGDRWFTTTGALASYATQFVEMTSMLKDATFALHGDGLLQHMIRTGSKEAQEQK